MKIAFPIFIVGMLLANILTAAPPDWFTSMRYREITQDTHIIGVGSGNSWDSAADAALNDLVKHIEVSVQTSSESYLASYKEGDQENIRESYEASTKSLASQSVKGAVTAVKAEDAGKYYVMSALDKGNFVRQLENELNGKKAEITKIRTDSDALLNEGKVFQAIDLRMGTEELYTELSTRASLYTSISGKTFLGGDFPTGPAILAESRKILSRMQIEKISGDNQSAKSGKMLADPLAVQAWYKKSRDEQIPLIDIRFQLQDYEDNTIERMYSGEEGVCKFWVYALGEDKQKYTVSFDMRNVPPVFRKDIAGKVASFKYTVLNIDPLQFWVEIFDKKGSRVPAAEETIARSVVKAGHTISEDGVFLLTGKIKLKEDHEVAGIDGTLNLVTTNLDLKMMVRGTDETIGNMEITAKGMDKKSRDVALERSYQNLLVDKKEMAKMLAKAGDKISKINMKMSTKAFEKGKALFDQGKYEKALEQLTLVNAGQSQIEDAQAMIRDIKRYFSNEAKKKLQMDLARRERESSQSDSLAREAEILARVEEAKNAMLKLKSELAGIDTHKLISKENIASTKTNRLTILSDPLGYAGKTSKFADPKNKIDLSSDEKKLIGSWIYTGAVETGSQTESFDGAGNILIFSSDNTYKKNDSSGKWSAKEGKIFVNGFPVPYLQGGNLLLLGYQIDKKNYMMVYRKY